MEESRKELTLHPDDENVAFVVEKEIKKLGKDGIVVLSSSVSKEHSSQKVYILQRWSKKWKAFVDVTDVKQIVDGDRLTIARLPFSPAKAASGFDTTRGEVSIPEEMSECIVSDCMCRSFCRP